MSNKSPYLSARFNKGKLGYIFSEKGMAEKDAKYMALIRGMDSKVIGSIYSSMQQRVMKEQPFLKSKSPDDFNREVERLTMDVMFKTQPTFEDVSRPLAATETNPLVRMAFVFSSQRNKNYYLLYSSFMDTANTISQYGFASKEFKDQLLQSGNTQMNLLLASGIVAGLNITAKEFMSLATEEKYATLPPDYFEYADKSIKEKFLKELLIVYGGNVGGGPSAVVSALQGFDLIKTPYDAPLLDLKSGFEALRMTQEMLKLLDAGKIRDLENYWQVNGLLYADKLSEGLNLLAAIPQVRRTVGPIPTANLYKWFYEIPAALVKELKETDREKYQEEKAKRKRQKAREKKEDISPKKKEKEELKKITDSVDKKIKQFKEVK
jgi:hypothetical protein